MKSLLKMVKNDLDTVIDLHKIFDDYPQLEKLEVEAETVHDDNDVITRIEHLTINGIKLNITGFELDEDSVDKLPEWLVDQNVEDLLNSLFAIVSLEGGPDEGSFYPEYSREEVESAYNIVEMCAQLRSAIDNFTS